MKIHAFALFLLLVGAPLRSDAAVILSGEVQAKGAKPIVMPPSMNSPTVIRYFKEEGSEVTAGEVVLKIDPAAAGSPLTLAAELEQSGARAAREIAELEVGALDAAVAALDAQAAKDQAALDAGIPKSHLSPLDVDRYASEAARSGLDFEQKTQAAQEAKAAVERRRQDAELERKKAEIELAFAQAERARTEVKAAVSGIVAYGFNEWRGRRYGEGESASAGATVGQILNGSATFVRAYALEVDRQALSLDMPVAVKIDALPGLVIESTIASISSAPEPRAAWGDGRYFQVDIELPRVDALLVPGMSAQIEPKSSAAQPMPQAPATIAAAALELEGEFTAARRSNIAPPTVKDTWQMTLQMLAPEGSIVTPADPIAVFDGTAQRQKLEEKAGKLKETNRAIEKLTLEHAQALRDEALAVQFAQSEAEKAGRKANQPADLVGGIAWRKLKIDFIAMSARARLAQQRQAVQARARSAAMREQTLLREQLLADTAELNSALGRLSVKPAIGGMVIHNVGFNGEKFTTGSQVFVGLSVASVFDLSSLRVNAWVPEALASRVTIGQPVQVITGTGARTLTGRVAQLGTLFRSRSRAQPVIVRDVMIELDIAAGQIDRTLKPGSAVRVRLIEESKR